jgi:RNA polymerase sigma factor (TIGR02999 family)
MTDEFPTELARTLTQAARGDEIAREALIDELYPRIRKMAAVCLNHERPDHTLQPTALANEAWIRIAASDNLDHASRSVFLAAAAKTLRRVLIDHARGHDAEKRGGRRTQVELTDIEGGRADQSPTVFDRLNAVLDDFARQFPRQHEVVELKYFGGLTVKQIAELRGISERTVANDWDFAKAWLHSRLGHA